MATVTVERTISIQKAQDIPELTHSEAKQLATTELERVLAVVETLAGDDWQQPTDCTEWTVRDMVAHLAGSCAGSASWSEFFRQMVVNPYILGANEPVDGVNRRQIEDRAEKSHTELIDELREAGPKAIRSRQRLPWVVRAIPMPLGGPIGFGPIGYLTDNIYTRDQWMHRVDICRAIGKPIQLTADHDARIVELALRDLAYHLKKQDHQHTIDLVLTGDLHLEYCFGNGSQADATVRMNVIEFNRLASGRATVEEVSDFTETMGNHKAADWFLGNCDVLY